MSAYASLTDEPISVELAERVLGDIVHNNESRPITPDVILNATSSMFGYDVEELKETPPPEFGPSPTNQHVCSSGINRLELSSHRSRIRWKRSHYGDARR